MSHLARRLRLVGLTVCAAACAGPACAINLAVNFSDAFSPPAMDIQRVSPGGALQPAYDAVDARGFMSLDTDASTGKLYGLGRYASSAPNAGRDFLRAWDPDGSFTDVLVDYSPLGLSADANAPNLSSPDLSVHNGHVAINYSDSFNPPRRDVLHVNASTGAALTTYAIPENSLGVVSLDYDAASGRLYGLGQYAFNAFDRREDFIRVWESDGTVVGDIQFDFTSIGLSPTTTIADSKSPDLAVHDGQIAINITDNVIAAKNVLHLNTSGAALTPYLGAADATTFLSLDFDPATGDLYGLGQYAFQKFNNQEDFIRRWVSPGAFVDVPVSFGTVGAPFEATVGFQESPDLAVAPTAPGGDVVLGDFNDDGCVDIRDYTLWRDNLGRDVTFPNDNGLGMPIGREHYELWRGSFGLKPMGVDPPMRPGDFNDDGLVDARDYAAWRDNLGSDTPLPNDAGLGAPIGAEHYDLWVANYGAPTPAPTPAAAPEPSAVFLALGAALAGAAVRRRRALEPVRV